MGYLCLGVSVLRKLVFAVWLVLAGPANAQFWGPPGPPSYPLDGQPRPAACYGTKRLLSAYTANKALDLSRDGNSTTIGFVNGVVDAATADAFCAGSSTCYITKWYDQCGSGLDASRAAGVTAPLWSSTNVVNGLRPVIFDFDINNDRVGLDQSSVVYTPGNPTTAIMVGQPVSSYNQSTMLFMSASFQGQMALVLDHSTNPPAMGMPSVFVSTTPVEVNPTIAGISWQSGTAAVFSNDQTSSGTAAAIVSKTGGVFGGANAGGLNAAFDAVAYLVYSSYLGSTQLSALQTKLASSFNIQTSFQDVVLADGDSFFTGHGATFDNSILRCAISGCLGTTSALKRQVRAYNNAINGETLATMLTNFSTNIPVYYQAGYRTFIVHLLAGANDIRASTSVSTIYSGLQTYVNSVHALGSNAKVIIATQPVQCDIFQNGTELAALQSLNNMILANWNVPQASGGLGADGLDDLFHTPTVGPGNYAGSAFCGSPNQYSQDGQHPTDLTMSLLGPVMGAAINAALP